MILPSSSDSGRKLISERESQLAPNLQCSRGKRSQLRSNHLTRLNASSASAVPPARKQLSLYGFTDRECSQVLVGKEDRRSALCRISVISSTISDMPDCRGNWHQASDQIARQMRFNLGGLCGAGQSVACCSARADVRVQLPLGALRPPSVAEQSSRSACGKVWESAWFGTRRPSVHIRPR